jgi:formate hydrogenlyase subunit 3/multisubunit Na+/H+ antiporter MnhD subunit
MSGVMIKTGIYGVVMMLGLLGPPPTWWGWLLIGIGVTSGVLGVLFALAQHDLKRLLAYHSVENIGIIALGLGVGMLGLSLRRPEMVVLGLAGGLLHVLNHALFKGLLFMGAGAVIRGTHTGDMDRLGGLQRKMPLTALTFLVGAVAICGLPPLNGFVSEFLIYLGSYEEEVFLTAAGSVPALAVIGSLALIGGLAAACFTKAFGVVFLGEPRSAAAQNARPPGALMLCPMVVLAAACLGIALAAPWVLGRLEPVLGSLAGESASAASQQLAGATTPLRSVVLATAGVLGISIVLAALRKALLSGREIGQAGTWDCGFAQPTARMQYTSSSYAQPITWFFSTVLRTRRKLEAPAGVFPKDASLHTETPDVSLENGYRPAFACVKWALSKLQWIQHGRVNLYVMYIALTILVLLVWFLGTAP